ncbi:MAG: hypothetical protein H0U49_11660, partial [Parachlamydiaceae bacterium]|nr:hypothetical protein [Parachlamydiaceae bacterium]
MQHTQPNTGNYTTSNPEIHISPTWVEPSKKGKYCKSDGIILLNTKIIQEETVQRTHKNVSQRVYTEAAPILKKKHINSVPENVQISASQEISKKGQQDFFNDVVIKNFSNENSIRSRSPTKKRELPQIAEEVSNKSLQDIFNDLIIERTSKEYSSIRSRSPTKKKDLPKLDLLYIQDPTSKNNTCCLSPRLDVKRQSYLDSIFRETHNLKGIGHLFKIEDETKSNKFDKKLNQHLQVAWASALKNNILGENFKTLPDIIEISNRTFLAREIDALYNLEKFELKDLLKNQSPRLQRLLNYYQCGGVPFKAIFPRYRLLRSILDEYLNACNEKTAYSEKLYKHYDSVLAKEIFSEKNEDIPLEKASSYDVKDDFIKIGENLNSVNEILPKVTPIISGKLIDNFIKNYNEVIHLTTEKKESRGDLFKRWAFAPLGEKEEEREGTINKLREWVAISEIDKNRLIKKLNDQTWEISRSSYLISQISTIFHSWFQNKDQCVKSLSKITYSQIFEKWKGMTVAFDIVKVNKKTFWDYRMGKLGVSPRHSQIIHRKSQRSQVESKGSDSSLIDSSLKISEIKKTELTCKEIFEGLFTAMSGKDKIDEEVEFQTVEFVAASKDISFQTLGIELRIPWMPLMRLTTDIAWDEADLYMRKLFPEIFMDPYSTKYNGHAECHINIKRGEVTQVKGLTIFLKTDKSESVQKKQVNLSM